VRHPIFIQWGTGQGAPSPFLAPGNNLALPIFHTPVVVSNTHHSFHPSPASRITISRSFLASGPTLPAARLLPCRGRQIAGAITKAKARPSNQKGDRSQVSPKFLRRACQKRSMPHGCAAGFPACAYTDYRLWPLTCRPRDTPFFLRRKIQGNQLVLPFGPAFAAAEVATFHDQLEPSSILNICAAAKPAAQ